jgi:hypothetical protein
MTLHGIDVRWVWHNVWGSAEGGGGTWEWRVLKDLYLVLSSAPTIEEQHLAASLVLMPRVPQNIAARTMKGSAAPSIVDAVRRAAGRIVDRR